MKFYFFTLTFLIGFCSFSQNKNSNYITKTVKVKKLIKIDSIGINSSFFSVKKKDNSVIDSTWYNINFTKATLEFKNKVNIDSVIVSYLKFPDFLTKTYQQLDDNIIVNNTTNTNRLYKLKQSNSTKNFIPFNGLST